jgi:hypothetical protein
MSTICQRLTEALMRHTDGDVFPSTASPAALRYNWAPQ